MTCIVHSTIQGLGNNSCAKRDYTRALQHLHMKSVHT